MATSSGETAVMSSATRVKEATMLRVVPVVMGSTEVKSREPWRGGGGGFNVIVRWGVHVGYRHRRWPESERAPAPTA